MTDDLAQAVSSYWGRPGLATAIFEALQAAGKDVDALTLNDLAPFDQFHGGGKPATLALARLARIEPGTRVLDVGGGLGGPARTLAVEFGCDVTVLDLTQAFLEAGEAVTTRLGLGDRVRFQVGNALAVPFPEGRFDLVWTQYSGMQIADKGTLYREFSRVLRPGGRLATQEPAAGAVQPPHFPLMWARDASTNFLLQPAELREHILAAGFVETAWEQGEVPLPPAPAATGNATPTSLNQIILGDTLAAIHEAHERNGAEGRISMIQAVFERR